ncbi:hypothetical protein COY32_01655 [candidate division WWE3 bacterium CG_4_10_14_0_2_um_filter_41_14]|uniref:Uncharacterized protein n=1 Tax=candidate division WWE3 bacterium CG_4_10_14_0_2_um_filter_41_14 TaxID=1975072 RepID=A0A2M7TLI3_UNCKA|nr:MAG: hypothetical protein COY32_01655 [candidate division WWE3 bacterium CG_4_10_14_0_2_um_filter_41_14]
MLKRTAVLSLIVLTVIVVLTVRWLAVNNATISFPLVHIDSAVEVFEPVLYGYPDHTMQGQTGATYQLVGDFPFGEVNDMVAARNQSGVGMLIDNSFGTFLRMLRTPYVRLYVEQGWYCELMEAFNDPNLKCNQ